ncbi:MAG: galactitol-1-phosphate 5-dehydrogenase [Oscillospiraceae bacterium]|nr:galactitol-1-phosphate 5-dehydrogenase [Oscillospiraceae bacterium]
MKGLAFYGIRDLRYEDVADPKIEKPDDVIIKVKAAGICGSDYARYKKLGPYIPGTVWGHEFAGEVVAVGEDAQGHYVGERVAACPSIVCGKCHYCQIADFAKCENLYAIGSLENGGFAEYAKMPAQNLVHLPDNVSYEEGSLIEPSTVALHALFKTSIKMGDEIAVVGCGTIGEMLIHWAKLFGVKVYAFDIVDDKLREAKELGADVVINTKDVEPSEALHEYTRGVDIAFESAGNPITAGQVLTLPRKGGEVVYVGLPYGDVHMPRNYFEKITRNELHVIGAFGVTSAPFPGKEWTTAADALARGAVNIKSVISHRAKLSEGPGILEDIMEHPAGYRKVILFPEWDNEQKEG